MTPARARGFQACALQIPRLLGMLALALLSACGYWRSDQVRGDPLDQEAVRRIVIGKTTRDDVFRLLGPPRSIVDGQADFERSISIPWGAGERTVYSVTENRFLRSVGDDYYVMVYRYDKVSGRGLVITPGGTGYRDIDLTVRGDELLVIMRKDTGVVADIAYSAPKP